MIKKIGLAGKSGSGKNVIADLMCANYGYTQIAVADGIREEAAAFIKNALGDIQSDCDLPMSFDLVIKAFVESIWAKPTPSEIRVLLQWWGTEYRRKEDSDYWIKQLSNRLQNDNCIVVSDVRLPDEMRVIREMGGEVWLVERAGIEHVGIVGHATEHGLADAKFDRVISNNGTFEDLENCLDKLLIQ